MTLILVVSCGGDDPAPETETDNQDIVTVADVPDVAGEDPDLPDMWEPPDVPDTGQDGITGDVLGPPEDVEEPEPGPPSLLVFTRTEGFEHESIQAGVQALFALGKALGLEVEVDDDGASFTEDGLAPYNAVVFLSTTGDMLDDAQQDAFESYIKGGGGFVGIHAAADAEYDWPWYGALVGAWFDVHPAVQEATVRVVQADHPATAGVPAVWTRTDEWYDFKAHPDPSVTVLLELDESTYEGGTMGSPHPIAWAQKFSGGRSFYTGMGHTTESYAEPEFRAHLSGGIEWAAGLPCTPRCDGKECGVDGCGGYCNGCADLTHDDGTTETAFGFGSPPDYDPSHVHCLVRYQLPKAGTTLSEFTAGWMWGLYNLQVPFDLVWVPGSVMTCEPGGEEAWYHEFCETTADKVVNLGPLLPLEPYVAMTPEDFGEVTFTEEVVFLGARFELTDFPMFVCPVDDSGQGQDSFMMPQYLEDGVEILQASPMAKKDSDPGVIPFSVRVEVPE